MMLALAATTLLSAGAAQAGRADKPIAKAAAPEQWRAAYAPQIAQQEAALAQAKARFDVVIDDAGSSSLDIERAEIRYNEARADYHYNMDRLRAEHDRANRSPALAAAAAR